MYCYDTQARKRLHECLKHSVKPYGYNPVNVEGRKKTFYFTMAILATGIIGLVVKFSSGSDMVLMVAFAGIFIYQWYLNSVMIKAGSRMMD